MELTSTAPSKSLQLLHVWRCTSQYGRLQLLWRLLYDTWTALPAKRRCIQQIRRRFVGMKHLIQNIIQPFCDKCNHLVGHEFLHVRLQLSCYKDLIFLAAVFRMTISLFQILFIIGSECHLFRPWLGLIVPCHFPCQYKYVIASIRPHHLIWRVVKAGNAALELAIDGTTSG